MIPYKGKVTLEKTLKYIETMGYNLNYNFTDLRFRLSEEDISYYIFKLIKQDKLSDGLDILPHLCEVLGVSVVNKENKKLLDEYVDLYLKNVELFPEDEDLDKLVSSFNDKKIPLEFLRYMFSNKAFNFTTESTPTLNHFIDYLMKSRQYYTDDRALLSSVINLVESVDAEDLMFGSDKDITKIIEKKLNDDRKSNGIYNVDEFTLEELDRKLSEFESLATDLQNLVDLTEQQINEIKQETKDSKDAIVSTRIQTLKSLKLEAGKVINNFRKAYMELLNKEKENLVSQKDMLMADMQVEFGKKKLELETLASNVGQRIAIELGRIRQQSSYSIDQMKDFISNNEEVRKMFDVAKQDQAFLSRLAKMDSIPMPELASSVMPGAVGAVPVAGAIAMPSIIVPKPEREVVEKINYYFDTNIPFKDRFKELMDKKKEDIKKTGAIYHKKFDDLLTIILNNDVPYMFGPSGCGKTYMIEKQLAKLLGLDVVTNGFIMYETDILGFNNANGVYVPSNFYRCYKYGDIIFLDELDNSSPSSTIVLNSFIGNDDDSYYTFPNGDRVKRHFNFRILAAGNTRGNGRTESHNTRKKIDEAVMQRLTPVEIDYDNRIEEKILVDYPGWYNFAINFRNAIKEIKIGGSDGPNYNGTLTTRDIEAIRRYKRDDSFSDEKIIEYEVIENKDVDYLNQIIEEMETLESQGQFTEGGIELFEKFKVLSKNRRY